MQEYTGNEDIGMDLSDFKPVRMEPDYMEIYQLIAGMVADFLFDYDIEKGIITLMMSDGWYFNRSIRLPDHSDKIRSRIHMEDYGLYESLIAAVKKGKRFFDVEYRILVDNGDYCWMGIQGRTYMEGSRAGHAIGRVYSIDRQKRENLKLYDEAKRDPLTKLFNKTHSQELIENYIKNMDYKRGAMFIIDVDNFKNVNDTMGHLFGDDTLAHFSKILKFHFRASDVIGRIGGDEFIAFMKDVRDIESVRNKADSICDAINCIYRNKRSSISISSSIGVSLFPIHGLTYEELFRKADEALYYTKANGKNGCTIYGFK